MEPCTSFKASCSNDATRQRWANLQVLDIIESGAFGSVYRAEEPASRSVYALKVIPLDSPQAVERFEREASIALQVTTSPYCIDTLDSFQRHGRGVLLMELMPTDLYSLTQGEPMEENHARFYFRQLCAAVEHFHSHDLVHLDIKPENVLVDEEGNAKLCDFGFASTLSSCVDWQSVGSRYYTAPETTGRGVNDPCKVDIWSLGVVLHFLLTARHPSIKKRSRTSLCVDKGILSCSSPCCDLLRQLLQLTPTRRPTIHEVLDHPWLDCVDTPPSSPFLKSS